MRLYSDSEIDLLLDELSLIAHEAIELAAGEAARAAILSMLEREAAALQEAERWQLEAQRNLQAANEARRAKVKNALIAGALCFFGGFAFGIVIR